MFRYHREIIYFLLEQFSDPMKVLVALITLWIGYAASKERVKGTIQHVYSFKDSVVLGFIYLYLPVGGPFREEKLPKVWSTARALSPREVSRPVATFFSISLNK